MKRKITRTPDTTTLEQAFEEFCFEKDALGRADCTTVNYKRAYEYLLEVTELDNDSPTTDFTVNHIYTFISERKKVNTKVTTLNSYLRSLRTFVNWLIEKKYIIEPFKVQLVKGQEETVKLFTEDELNIMLIKPQKYDSFADWRTWYIICFVLSTGVRASTICNLRVSDINFTSREIVLAHTKNKKAQIIPLSSALAPDLKEYIRIWRTGTGSEWLFPNVGDEQLTYTALRCSFERYCKRRGIQRHNFHGLRHNFAKGWVQSGGNVFALQRILGHSTITMTQRYVTLFTDDLKDGYDDYTVLGRVKKGKSRKQVVKRNG